MQVIGDALRASDLPRGGVVTIGNYDGIHRGQQAVLDLVEAIIAQQPAEGLDILHRTLDAGSDPRQVAPVPHQALVDVGDHVGAHRVGKRGGDLRVAHW